MIKKFIEKIKPKAKYILGVLGIAAVVSQGAFAVNQLSANSPRFNFMNGDFELLRGANQTAGENVWKDPVAGDVGDTFKGIVYYHNGIVGTVAENTRVKVTIPNSTSGNSAVLSARISADNAETVTDTVIDGQIVGQSGLTANLDSSANLELVPGSVKWYPDQQNSPDTPHALPFGQTGDEITSGDGINLGNINGCWEYAGYVVFAFRTVENTAPALNIEKTVRNITTGENNYVEVTNASANDEVEYKISITNPGTQVARNVKFSDSLPSDLSFKNGSMKIYRDGADIPEAITDEVAGQIFAAGWTFGDMQTGAGKATKFVFSAKAPSEIAVAKQVVNTATAVSDSLSDSDIAKVNLIPDGTPNIVLNKTAKNLTSGQIAENRIIAGKNVLALDAVAGDSIEYTLITKNTGNASSDDYLIQDGIADILEYAEVISISDGGSVIDGTNGNDSKLVSYPVVDIAEGESVERTFTVKVLNPIPGNPPSGFSFDMQMYNKYGDEVIVVLSRPTPPQPKPILKIEKLVRDFTINQVDFVDHNEAIAGDTLEYLIKFENGGDGPADQINFSDILPANTEFIPGTTIISINGDIERTLSDGIVADGVILDTLAAGDSGYIKFKVITYAGIPAGETLVNTANLTDNGVTISDTAKTTFKAPVVLTPSPITPLPKTGAESILISAAVAVLAMIAAYRVAKLS